jgi:hypothetical protein
VRLNGSAIMDVDDASAHFADHSSMTEGSGVAPSLSMGGLRPELREESEQVQTISSRSLMNRNRSQLQAYHVSFMELSEYVPEVRDSVFPEG